MLLIGWGRLLELWGTHVDSVSRLLDSILRSLKISRSNRVENRMVLARVLSVSDCSVVGKQADAIDDEMQNRGKGEINVGSHTEVSACRQC